MAQLRSGLLDGRAVAVAGSTGPALSDALVALGARVEQMPGPQETSGGEREVGEWSRSRAPLTGIVFDAGQRFGAGGVQGLTATMEEAWSAVREVAVGALIPADGPGKIVLVGPRPDAGPAAAAARDGLESLVRTLAVEWARYQITAALIAPGKATRQEAVTELACFLCSPAGEYLSGCRLELGARQG